MILGEKSEDSVYMEMLERISIIKITLIEGRDKCHVNMGPPNCLGPQVPIFLYTIETIN